MSFINPFLTSFASLNRKFNMDQLKAYYKFNESSGNLLNHATSVGSIHSNGIEGTNAGTVHGATGKIGNSYDYATTTDLTSCGSNGNWNFLHQDNTVMTICGWFYITTFRTLNIIASTTNVGSNPGFFIITSSTDNKLSVGIRKTAGAVVKDILHTTVLSTGTWYFFAMRFDEANTTLKIRVNTTEVTATDAAVSDTSTSNLLRIGNNSVTTQDGMDGRCDEFSFWNRLLTDIEIDTLYNSGNGFELI